ncbi:tRNA uridine-5-carboxymethylaminomethyl(34) synthesis GTPase MnmE [Blattabacterium cuenoti]|uniref:tRNA uridine-5-carboxymethylaminomethyl(34) synthesis GTPase MnmE n=1 Tax=Blattabacterium cuenoti TaxID=1653831 RepID=UPI00163CA45E|nr:tRNA uridine-5-carboxymethylaminomethyl(34) synthesis GTPase MnmE [Blattabacterium cuenoti]
MLDQDTIVALASSTTTESSAISLIRISGNKSISTVENIFIPVKNGKKLENQSTHTIHLGFIVEEKKGKYKKNYLDQVLVSIFRSPFSYTGEDMIEISCHGSNYIQGNIIKLLIKKGIRIARPGEFTLRAFLNKKIDLSQAEAIADIFSSESKISHELSLEQIKGTLKITIQKIKKKILNIASLLELKLDFSEEKISIKEYDLFSRFNELEEILQDLIESFSLGNSIKNGIYVAITGETNVGKSTLFNHVIKENRSIISNIEGTTRDSIEGDIILNNILFHFIDTAGIRDTKDEIERKGIRKTMEKIKDSQVILYLFEASIGKEEQKKIIHKIQNFQIKYPFKKILVVANKSDLSSFKDFYQIKSKVPYFFEISAEKKHGIKEMLHTLCNFFMKKLKKRNIVLTQNRHYEALKKTLKEILIAHHSLKKNLSEEFISIHIKEALRFLGEISGEVTNEDVLNNIFSKFCIGK